MIIPSVYVVGGYPNYANWLIASPVTKLSQAGLVMFCGGTDIDPSIYGKKSNPRTQAPDCSRDAKEKEIFELCLAMKIPMVGICRGAQFICAMAGGSIVQHSNHPSFHFIHTDDGRQIWVTSDHHQRMAPWGIPHLLLGWTRGLSPFNQGETIEDDMTREDKLEAEVVYFPQVNALCIQDHPEWQFPANGQLDHEAMSYHRGLVKRLMVGGFSTVGG